MISINLMGGVGNQLFQWALGVSLEQNDSVQYTTNHFSRDRVRFYMLDQLGLDLRLVDHGEEPVIHEGSLRFKPEILDVNNCTLNGYWQSEKYLKRVEYKVKSRLFQNNFKIGDGTAKVLEEIVAANSCFIHVRRSDTLSARGLSFHGLIDLDYYNKAADYVRERIPDVRFFVFSDDHDWVRQNMTASDMTIVDFNKMSGITQPDNEVTKQLGGREVEDLFLMSQCRNAIIPNSSFGWWGAWLGDYGQGRIVVCPERWFVSTEADSTDICPERWIRF